ncbi:MAG: SGNH/GDSL hydrolase family protein, partial [Planctomycetota bacterium]
MLPALAFLLPSFAPPAAAPAEVDPALPNVLLIGDSISIGYTKPTREALAGEANVYRIPTNGGPTTRGLEQIDAWLGDRKWDVIHVNWGLHDLKYMKGDRRVAPGEGTRQVAPEDYKQNLAQLFDRLEQTSARLIWATTTPVPEGAKWRVSDDSVEYNRIAAAVMKDRNVAVNDLHAVASANLASLQKPRDVHFTPAGSKTLAEAVAEA